MNSNLTEFLNDEAKKDFFNVKTEEVCDILLEIIKDCASSENAQKRAIKELSIAALNRIKVIILLVRQKHSEDALILWRSLYEMACILAILAKSDNTVADEYYRFKTTKDIGKEQKDLKMETRNGHRISKGSFQNYGWIHKVNGYTDKTSIAFSGVEQLAELGQKKEYNIASNFVHAIKYNYNNADDCFANVILFLSKTISNIISIAIANYNINNQMVNEHKLFVESLVSAEDVAE